MVRVVGSVNASEIVVGNGDFVDQKDVVDIECRCEKDVGDGVVGECSV